jgi:16S rRNA (guanine527-N7)-methyltransferase
MSAFLAELRKATAGRYTDAEYELMNQHWELVLAWNQRVNLTAITNGPQAAWMHYADSLAGQGELVPGSVADLGSGAGYPGTPLAIVEPSRQFTLIEPRQKRASFIDVSTTRLGLKNIRAQVGRSEDTPLSLFPNVVTRATFSNPSDLRACLSWVAPAGRLIAYRAGDTTSDADRIVPYQLQGETHALHIWSK